MIKTLNYILCNTTENHGHLMQLKIGISMRINIMNYEALSNKYKLT